ncbi:MAG TPA: glycosyltransferase family 2 protein [Holophagaceae bacterium]|nr:glycosyltransferase family 2 protein [Holophagaceae bacterium]
MTPLPHPAEPGLTGISVIVPVYKGEAFLEELHRRVRTSLASIPGEHELLLVEDRGGDGSWAAIQRLAGEDPLVRGIQFSRNFGQHAGITAGLDLARGSWVVVMDCDLQDRPEEIPRLHAKALEGFDVVVARRGRRKDSWMKRTTSRLFYSSFSYLSGLRMDPQVGNFRIISRKVVEALGQMRERTRFFVSLVEWMGFPTASVDVEHAARAGGQSTYSFRKLMQLALEVVIAYSDKPLWLAIRFGFTISLLSMLGGGVIIYRALRYGSPVMGWSSLVVSLYFLGGIIISILGVIGVYLGKTFEETKRRPHYIIANRVN